MERTNKQIKRIIKNPQIIMNKLLYIYHNMFCRMLYQVKWHCYKGQIPELDGTRESYRVLLLFLVNNVVKNLYDKKKGYFQPSLCYNYSYNDLPCDVYELIARSFIGVTYLLVDGDSHKLSNPYRESIRRGINRNFRYYWGRLNHQRIIENGSIIIGFLQHKELFWDKLTKRERSEMIYYIKESTRLNTYFNSWMWFRLFHYLFLERFEGINQETNIRDLFQKISTLYCGDGWYNDAGLSNDKAFDEYNGWAYHYYGPLFCLLADSRYDDIKETIKKRLKLFCSYYINFFNTKTLPIFWGRSMVYRFANMACFGLGVKLGVIEQEQYPLINAKISGTINAFLGGGSLDHRGLLSQGYLQPIPKMLEGYCGIGSGYWALKAFSVLLLEESHPFWQKNEQKKEREQTNKVIIKSVPMYVENNCSGQGFMLNGGIFTTKWDKRKYNAFAYSNTFPIILDDTYVSNSFIFLHNAKKKIRDSIDHAKTTDELVFHVEWTVSSIKGFKAYTTMFPLNKGYCLIHHIKSPEKIAFVYSGFAIPEKEVLQINHQRAGLDLQTHQYASSLTVMTNAESSYGYKRLSAKNCVVNKETVIPWCRSYLKPGMNIIVTCAQAMDKEEYKPTTIIKHDYYIEIQDAGSGKYQFVKDSGNYYYRLSGSFQKEA